MNNTAILPSSISFLNDLATNNNRDWFADHKESYLDAQNNMINFVAQLIELMNAHDAIENASAKKSLYRIYNDVRFSKDKLPYKVRFAFSLQRSSKAKRGGYYMNIQPGNNFLACGFFAPNPEDLKRIRKDIELNPALWRKLLNAKPIKDNFGDLTGNQVPTFPKGFPKDHEAIDLIRHKQLILRHSFTDAEILAPDLVLKVNSIYQTVRPFLDHLSIVLTTDLNGQSLL